jgi:signal transduction histidine kinase/CheY-like chemotaxis protein/ligand-binding sensor domain-containing protein
VAQGQHFVFKRVNDLPFIKEVFSVDPDEYGRLWYSSWGRGVFCFDGYTNTRYISDSGNPNAIRNDRIFDILIDKQQRVWMANLNGLDVLHRPTGRMEHIGGLPDSVEQVTSMVQDRAGRIWMGGSSHFSTYDETFKKLVPLKPGPGIASRGGRVRCMLEDVQFTIWAGRTDGLFRFSPDRSTYYKVQPTTAEGQPLPVVLSMLATSEARLLLGTTGGLFALDAGLNRITRLELPDSLAFGRINAMVQAPDGALWISINNQGLLKWQPATGEFMRFRNQPLAEGSIGSDVIYSMAIDVFSNLWLGTTTGIYKINLLPQAFSLWPLDANDLRSHLNAVVRIAEDRYGRLLVRTNRNLYLVNKLGDTVRSILQQEPRIVPDDFMTGKDGTVWANYGRLYYWDEFAARFIAMPLPNNDGDIYNMAEDADDSNILWLGVKNGLVRFDRRAHHTTLFSNICPPNHDQTVRNLIDDGNGNLWLDVPFFLACFDKKTGQTRLFNSETPPPHQLVNNEVLDLNRAPDGWIWISTTSGITKIEPGTLHFYNITRHNGLPDNVVNTVMFDRKNNAWAVCPEHIVRFEANTGRNTIFNTFNLFNLSNPTRGRCELRNGQLIFATSRGMLHLDPDRNEVMAPPSAVLLTRFSTSGLSRSDSLPTEYLQKVQLGHLQNSITIEWAGIQTAASELLRYECMLEKKGGKAHWEYKGAARQAVFANLDPGTYIFRARVVGIEKPELTLYIIIAPAWYQAQWFKMLLMALFAMIAYLILRTREDQRELRQQKELAEKNALYKTRFLANMSHEIRTPMNAILGLSRLLTESKLPPKAADYADAILQSSENLLVIINDVLDQAKIESGKFKFQQKPFDLDLILRHLENTLGYKAAEKKLQFRIDVAANTPALLIGDPVRLNQILTNLLGNAIKFTESGHVRLSVQAHHDAQNKRLLEFCVEDTGIGIAADQLQKVFESFQQADDEISATYGGTGLGLSITKELVEQQDGRIELHSESGQGTRIQVWMPYTLSTEAHLMPKPAENKLMPLENLRILLVEDTIFNQLLARELLLSRIPGAVVDLAENGAIALEKWQQSPDFDLILMDVKMPVMDGLEATRRLRRMPGGNHIPVIALTANAVPEELEKCTLAGMNAWVTKPIDTEELLYTIQRALENRFT